MTRKNIEDLIKADQTLDDFATKLIDAVGASDIPEQITWAQTVMMHLVMDEWVKNSGFKNDTDEYEEVCTAIYYSNLSLKKKVDMVTKGLIVATEKELSDGRTEE